MARPTPLSHGGSGWDTYIESVFTDLYGGGAGTPAPPAAYQPATANTKPLRNGLLPASLKSWRLIKGAAIGNNAATWRSTNTGMGYDVVWDDATQQYAVLIAAYNGTNEQIGLFYTSDFVNFTEYGSNPVLTNSAAGQPDTGGCTFPQLVRDKTGTWHMFYVGFPTSGYEQGVPNICRASATSLTGPWTKHGSVIAPAAVTFAGSSGVIYRPNVIFYGGTYYMFFNAGPAAGTEDIFYATATAPDGTWTVNQTGVITNAVTGNVLHSDPNVFIIGERAYCLYWDGNGISLAYCLASAFPAGPWTFFGTVLANTTNRTQTRPVTVVGPGGTTLLTANGGAPGSMDVWRATSDSIAKQRRMWSYTGGNYSVTSTTWVNLDTGRDITIPARAGDLIEVTVSSVADNGAPDLFIDVATVVSGAVVNVISNGSAEQAGWQGIVGAGAIGGSYQDHSASASYILQAGDIADATVLLRLRARIGSAGTRGILASGGTPFTFTAINHGPATTG